MSAPWYVWVLVVLFLLLAIAFLLGIRVRIHTGQTFAPAPIVRVA